MEYDVVVIGAGLSGMTAAALLAKRGLKTAVIDNNYKPGGSCGIFKRNSLIFDQGASMLFGFGPEGFNAHRFVFNCLEEPIDMIKHDLLYCIHFKDRRIMFWNDLDRFIQELATAFPSEKNGIERFYKDLEMMYRHVMVENPNYTTPDELDPITSMKSLLRHPVSNLRFLRFMNRSARGLLEKYFSDLEIFNFFNKLTSTYCYTTLAESPAILAAVMFVDNHVGGSYYPAGSTLFLPGILEKVIEENGGDMLLEKEALRFIFENEKPVGVALRSGEIIRGKNLVYSGTVWNLYERLIEPSHTTGHWIQWATDQIPTYPSLVLYACVDRRVIPEDTLPVEMLAGNPDVLDENEVTVYLPSIDDHTLCPEDSHIAIAIGPSFDRWDMLEETAYLRKKEEEKHRLISLLEKRFPGFESGLRYSEAATPRTIERYTMKKKGAVAGPKQMLGQHLFHRLHTRSDWDTLFCCGESTVMGTGTPAVTVSGLSAANAILKKLGQEPYAYRENMKNFVRIVAKPYTQDDRFGEYPEEHREIMLKASACQYCERPACSPDLSIDVRGVMRRLAVGNFTGARRAAESMGAGVDAGDLAQCERNCVLNAEKGHPVEIRAVFSALALIETPVKGAEHEQNR